MRDKKNTKVWWLKTLENETRAKSQQRFKVEGHCVYTAEINKISLSCNNDKRLQNFGKITIYPSGKYAKVRCKYKWLILMIIQMKTKWNIIKSSHIFQIIHTEY